MDKRTAEFQLNALITNHGNMIDRKALQILSKDTKVIRKYKYTITINDTFISLETKLTSISGQYSVNDIIDIIEAGTDLRREL